MHAANIALLTFAAAAVAGIAAQIVAHRWRLPAIVLLLAFGIALGPSALGVLHPERLGAGLPVFVRLSVAVILFDGALNLRLGDLHRALREVRNLVTIGALVTWVGAASAAWLIAGLSPRVSIIFGALLTVTGPTVVQPILRRVRITRRLKTILEGEAILIDPIGAVFAVAVIDVMLGAAGVRPIGVLSGAWTYGARLVVGAAVGVAAAYLVSWLLRRRSLVPSELANLVSLAGVWGAFALAEWIQNESGIMAAVAMGLAMQRGAVPEERRLRRFKEQLTVLGISLLFILLSANLPIDVVRAEGVRGLLTVAALMFIVRPVSVWISLRRTTLSWRERAFISWIAPRGVVAASVASLFAIQLTDAGFAEGQRLLALTFLTIAITVTLQGLTASLAARVLRLESLRGRGLIIVGAGPFAIETARVLREYDRPIVVIDRNVELVAAARAAGLEAVAGNALDESDVAAAGGDEAETVVAMTTNSEVNVLATQVAHEVFGVARTYPVLTNAEGATVRLLEQVGGHVAFGRPVDVREWEHRLTHDGARILRFRIPDGVRDQPCVGLLPDSIVALARVRQQTVEIATADQLWRAGDSIVVLTTLSEGGATVLLDELAHSRPERRAAHGVAG